MRPATVRQAATPGIETPRNLAARPRRAWQPTGSTDRLTLGGSPAAAVPSSMIISAASDYRAAAEARLPPFLFHYIDGGAYAEHTLRRNVSDLADVALRQRVLRNMSDLRLSTELFGETLAMPVALAPVGLTGMYARRGEVQAARAAAARGIPFTLSTVSVCPIEEVAPAIERPMWFQLYVLKDRGFMRNALERARAAGVTTLVFTVDMPTPGARYRDAHSGMSGPNAALRRMLQAVTHPRWAWDVGLLGKPHDLGNISAYRGSPTGLQDYIGWLGANFDPSIAWKDLEWIREFWTGPMVIKGILDPEDARDAVRFGADGIVVSNHGGRQLDGVLSSARALPAIADAVKGELKILADSGIRSGLDVVRMLALGADAVLLGRAFVYALAAGGQAGVENLLTLIEKEMRVAMTLTGTQSIADISADALSRVTRERAETISP
ncbi:L-lactate dehydrogenase (cytochrome) [Xanthomonas phaseoli pv. phaseoli]|uniref:L-lactate dehydrogenase n=7 Tax=Xanthomonas TaxID=338 RepID=A0AB38E3P6_XANCH|nr:L-lactate dehydrogenase (cytochrome) [Xanthomonas phaseoli pv. phaseoli]SON91368.1 L-lactate dehydrogenase (cytochrome) [Xanthomonas phaseoli pv. phaseoli]SOO28596.1 L-lactate dehydrogenase (cytochrome) [Xanthomonas phaseoli pv. phaseoli]